jgi:ArsR family transcriptional regulator, lead/cadmium/zinc/bismuth-responsive transcriptional repressor
MERRRVKEPTDRQLEVAAAMFDALSDMPRLRTLMLLKNKELSVSEIAVADGEKMTTVSARLQILHAARLIARRRNGKTVLYSIADDHVLTLVENAVAHAEEPL